MDPTSPTPNLSNLPSQSRQAFRSVSHGCCPLSGVAVGGAGVLPAAGAELRAGAGHRHVPGLGQGAGVTLGASLQHVVTPGRVSL